MHTNSYSTDKHIKTYFGNGNTLDTAIISYCVEGVTAFHNLYATGTYSIKHVLYNGSTAIDSISYSYFFEPCQGIAMQFYLDKNSDCTEDSGEYPNVIPILVQVDSNSVPIDTISCTSGIYYHAFGEAGDIYSFKLISDSNLIIGCPSSRIIYDTLVLDTSIIKNIPIECGSGSFFDLSVIASMSGRTGRHWQTGNIYATNNHCFPIDAVVILHHDKRYNGGIYSATPPAVAYTDSTVTWELSSLAPDLGVSAINYTIMVDSTWLIPGDTVGSTVVITPTTGDVDSSNNICQDTNIVVSSYDPNEMTVLPAQCIQSDSVTQLQYTINFTNTGNDTAFNIYVMDTLSPNVNPKSLRIIMASAAMNISEFNDGTNNIVKFDFPHINLIDSLHNPAKCSGAVFFKIKTIAGLHDSSTIQNHAGIFFDDNPVVLTNTVVTTIGCPAIDTVSDTTVTDTTTSVAIITKNKFSLFPNPAHNAFTITSSANISNVVITDLLGEVVYEHNYATQHAEINVAGLPTGIYFVKINGSEVRKFVKE